jgi:putative sugar O-methyltransferase
MGLSIGELRSLYDKLARNARVIDFYARFPRTFLWGKQDLEVSTSVIRDATDINDLIYRVQKTPLFGAHADTDFRKMAIEWLVTKYRSCGMDVESMPTEVEESQYCSPDICVDRAGRRMSVDFFRTLAIAHDLRHLIQKGGPPLHTVELRAGLGHLARTLRLLGVSGTHLILDLPEALIFSYAFLTMNFPDARAALVTEPKQAKEIRAIDYDLVFVPTCFAESIDFSGAELFVNTASLGEMNNQTIRSWMHFVQHRLPVKHLFTQNRFLNLMDPISQAWRWEKNEASVHYDSTWTILKWDLEPLCYQCPYIAPHSVRSLDIAASREGLPDPVAKTERSGTLLEEVKREDWFRAADKLPDTAVRQRRFVTDVSMTGTLFKLWESIRLHASTEAVLVLLRYLATLNDKGTLSFEETPYYEQLYLKLAETDERPEFSLYRSALRDRITAEPASKAVLVGATQDYDILSMDFRVVKPFGASVATKYYAVAKALAPLDLFGGNIGERELPGLLWIGDTMEGVIEKARTAEPELRLEDSIGGYNIVKTRSGYLAIAHSVGPIDLFRDRIGDKELAPVLLKADTFEAIRKRITDAMSAAALPDVPTKTALRFISLADQEPLTEQEKSTAKHMAGWVKGLLEDRDSRVAQLGLDSRTWLPAANWDRSQPLHEAACGLMRGDKVEWLRMVMPFTGFTLWSMARQPVAPMPELTTINQTLSRIALTPDHVTLDWCGRLRGELPEYLRIGPPAKFGEVGWLVDGVIVNQDTAVYWERLAVLYRAGFLDRDADRRLKSGSRILEIGAGYGGLAYYIQRAVPGVQYTVLDIPESLIYSAIYLSVVNPDAGTAFLPNYEFPKLVQDGKQFDLVINTLSMAEMSEGQVRAYCEGIRTLIGSSGAFFEQNQDNRHEGMLNARGIIRDYFAKEQRLGGPGLAPFLTQGHATLWSN